MKKTIATVTVLALTLTSLQTARAGDREWATVGKVLTGVAVGVVIANALECQPAYYPVTYARCAPRPAPVVYVSPRVVCAPAPVVYVPAPVVVQPRPVFITPWPLVNVNYAYHRGYPGRGHGHGYRW